MGTYIIEYSDGYTKKDPDVMAAVEKLGAVDHTGYYKVEAENWSDANCLRDAVSAYDTRRKEERAAIYAKQKARNAARFGTNPYSNFN